MFVSFGSWLCVLLLLPSALGLNRISKVTLLSAKNLSHREMLVSILAGEKNDGLVDRGKRSGGGGYFIPISGGGGGGGGFGGGGFGVGGGFRGMLWGLTLGSLLGGSGGAAAPAGDTTKKP
ncbi:hypothetical protein RvY_07093-2 [Ramazzottius varieornatus]|uniref:Uncharacterized protein n=1 Tax=Ramazzottius varieornatus TaxID=947166 RepID=A0A1D1V158_RAMVA|nr:hypothetical protein RvY_07093-2 [Ramazzottius varieornatus]